MRMQTIGVLFLAGVAGTSGAAIFVAKYFRRHLRPILTDLCGMKARADFWCAFSSVALVLVPLTVVLGARPAPDSWLWYLADEIQLGLIGLALTIAGIGMVIGGFIWRTTLTPGNPADGK